jgi:hypothetical protein
MKMAVLWNFYLGTLVSFSTMNDSNPCHYVHTMMTTKMSQFFDQLSRVEYVDCVWGMNRYFKGYLHDKWFRVICSYTTFRCRMTPIMMMCIVQYCKVSYDTKIIFRANWGAVQILSRVLFAKGKIMIDWNGSRWSSWTTWWPRSLEILKRNFLRKRWVVPRPKPKQWESGLGVY